MGQVVFLRGVNVGGHRTFRPSMLAKELAQYDVVNVGAAGTYVVRGRIDPASLRAEILGRLPFEAELMICPEREILALAEGKVFKGEPEGNDIRRFISVLATLPSTPPSLPLTLPDGASWEVKVVGVAGRYAFSLQRAGGKLYPNEVVEKAFGVAATSRNWNTIDRIRSFC